jgi:predicted nucleotidyltransferase
MEITKILSKVAAILKNLKIPYAVTGGVAVAVWGRARYTADIDIVVDIAPQKLQQLISRLSKIDKGVYLDVDTDAPIDFLKKRRSFNLIHSHSGVKVDFIIKKDNEFARMELGRAIKKDFYGQEIFFISPEDLVLIKLKWHKESESSRHLEDAESILKISKEKMDIKYLRKWAKQMRTTGILNDLLKKLDIF